MAPSLLSYFSIVSMSWFTFAMVSILCCGPLTCFLLATPLDNSNIVSALISPLKSDCDFVNSELFYSDYIICIYILIVSNEIKREKDAPANDYPIKLIHRLDNNAITFQPPNNIYCT